MDIFKGIIFGAGILLISGAAFATTCPPIDVIKNANFIKASSMANDWWKLTTAPYSHKGKVWMTTFKFPAYFDNEKEALSQGIVTFSSISTNIQDPIESARTQVHCLYTDAQDYEVTAEEQI